MEGELKRQVIEGMEKGVWVSGGNGSLEFRNLANGQPFHEKPRGRPNGFLETASRTGDQRVVSEAPINQPLSAHTRSYIGDLPT
jgi:hypothetical protein